jgi:hypothetical protein
VLACFTVATTLTTVCCLPACLSMRHRTYMQAMAALRQHQAVRALALAQEEDREAAVGGCTQLHCTGYCIYIACDPCPSPSQRITYVQ